MYVSKNVKSLAELKRALKAGEVLEVFAPGLGTVPENGTVYVEGPHYPAPHTWYGQVTLKNGIIVSVK